MSQRLAGTAQCCTSKRGAAELGRPELSAEFQDKWYFFASVAQVASFQANPQKFIPALGGMYAFGGSIEKDFPVDPTSYKIVNGQLLLFLKNAEVDAKALWERDGDAAYMVKANRHWQSTLGF